MKNKLLNKTAFTLVEIIIYLAIFSLVFTSFIGIFFIVDKSNKNAIAQKQVQNASIYLSQHIQESFKSANQIVSAPTTNIGNGTDGACVISTTKDITASTCVGRTYADAVSTSSKKLTSINSSTITLTSLPNGLVVNDEILIINMQGTSTNYNGVGQYETKYISAINGTTITLSTPTNYLFDGTTQDILVQRVPNYSTVTVNSPGIMTAGVWNGTTGGVMFFRTTGTVNVTSGAKIDMSSTGYRNLGTVWQGPPGGIYYDSPGLGGETYNGMGNNGCLWNGSYLCPNDIDALANGASFVSHQGGGSGSAQGLYSTSGGIGGGGGGGGWNFGYQGGYGGGGGYGTTGKGPILAASFAGKVDYNAGASSTFFANDIVAGDFNRDGKQDFLAAFNTSNKIGYYGNTGSGVFAAEVDYTTPDNATRIAVGDIDNDGKLDIVTFGGNSSQITILKGNGDGTFAAATQDGISRAATGSMTDMALADLNGDGKLDIVIANNSQNNFSVLINSGTGTFPNTVQYSAGTGAKYINVADINKDGKADVIVSSQSDNKISTFINNGNGTFANQMDYVVGTNPGRAAAADLENDGDLDSVFASPIIFLRS